MEVELGEMPVKIIIEDPSGNSAIIDKRATVEKLKVKSLVQYRISQNLADTDTFKQSLAQIIFQNLNHQ